MARPRPQVVRLTEAAAERIKYVMANAAKPVVGVRVLIDPKAILFLIGTEMDYKTDKLAAQFVFNNPNQTSTCGCGESVQLKPAADGGADAHS